MPFFSTTFTENVTPKKSTGGNYLNPSSIEDGGSVRFCILSDAPLEGYEIWFSKSGGGKTKRITPDYPDAELLAQLEQSVGGVVDERDGRKAIKLTSAFFCYDYEAECVRLFQASQKSLLHDIQRLTSEEDYADLSQWDLKISRTGIEKETRYHVSMVPTKRCQPSVLTAVTEAWNEAKAAGATLDALYDGGNPFGKA